jgi:hypothetical protein
MAFFIKKQVDRIVSKKYRDFIKEQKCCCCAAQGITLFGSDCAHSFSKKWAEGDDTKCIPLCRRHHDEQTGSHGMQVFLDRYGLVLAKLVVHYQVKFTRLYLPKQYLVMTPFYEPPTFEEILIEYKLAVRGESRRKNRRWTINK